MIHLRDYRVRVWALLGGLSLVPLPNCQRSFNRQSTAFVMRGLGVRLPPLALSASDRYALRTVDDLEVFIETTLP